MGALDYLSNFCTVTSTRSKLRSMQTVEIKVKMDCDGCERRVRSAVSSLRGVRSVVVNRKQHRVTVSGYVDANKVLKKVKSTGKIRAEFWPYIPQHLVYYPHAHQAYDKKAPPGFVRNVVQAFPTNTSTSTSINNNATPDAERFISLFSDDNVNACSIM